MDSIEGDDQLRIFRDGRLIDCKHSCVPIGSTVPILEQGKKKLADTLHLKIDAKDSVRQGILITHDKAQGKDFVSLPTRYQKHEGLLIKKHKPSGMIVIVCGSKTKTWMGGLVSQAVYDLVRFFSKLKYTHSYV